MKETAARNGIFYGWFIVAAGAFALFMSMGARNGFGVFVVPMTDDLGWSRTEISAAIAVGILVNGLSQPFLGRLYDRFGGRSVISLSLLVLGLSTILITFTSDFGLSFAPAISLPFLEIELSASLLFLILIYGLGDVHRVQRRVPGHGSRCSSQVVRASSRGGTQPMHRRNLSGRTDTDSVRRFSHHLDALEGRLARAWRAGAHPRSCRWWDS